MLIDAYNEAIDAIERLKAAIREARAAATSAAGRRQADNLAESLTNITERLKFDRSTCNKVR